MSGFTMRLKRVIEFKPDDVSRETFIGLGSYPIFDSAYKPGLDTKIIDHFWNREIGMETIQLFQLAVRRRMNEYMPFANQLYQSELIDFDPLTTVKLKTAIIGESLQENEHEGNNTSDTASTSASRSVSSDMPQVMLSGNGDYASSATDANAQGSVEGSGTESSTDKVESNTSSDSTTEGYQGVPADLIMATRAAFMNIDMMIIEQLEDCFLGVFSNGDVHMPPPNYGRFYL